MCEQITINIEIKPHLKKYLIATYNQEPVQFPYRHNYNRFLVHNITKPPKDFKIVPANENTICIALPKNNLKDISSFNFLSENKKTDFKNEIEEDFWTDAKEYINSKMKDDKLNKKEAIILLMKMWNILESELTFDAIYKHFQRERKKHTLLFTFSIF